MGRKWPSQDDGIGAQKKEATPRKEASHVGETVQQKKSAQNYPQAFKKDDLPIKFKKVVAGPSYNDKYQPTTVKIQAKSVTIAKKQQRVQKENKVQQSIDFSQKQKQQSSKILSGRDNARKAYEADGPSQYFN